MAKAADHIALANRNQEALDFLLREHGRFSEWVATIAFYKAVHIVEALFAHSGAGTTSSHRERLYKLKAERRFQHIHKHFRVLWQASTIARYLCDPDGRAYRAFSDYISTTDVEAKIVRHRLHEIEQSAVKLAAALGKKLRRVSHSRSSESPDDPASSATP